MSEEEIQAVLHKKLEEYGESVLENLEKKPKKKRKPKIEKSEELDEKKASKNSNTDLTTDSVGQRKRKKKKKHMIETNKDSFETKEIDQHTDTNSQVGKLKHLNSIKCELGLTEFKNVQLDKEETVIKKSRREPEVVVFTSHKKKQKQLPVASSSNTGEEDLNPSFDLKNARYEVRKLGIEGFHGDEKQKAMTAFLMRLGAKPQKRKYHNYKDYQEIRKKEIAAEIDKREADRKLGFKVAKADSSRKRKRDRNDVGLADGQVGKWKNGVQVVKKKDLKGVKLSKIKF